MTVEVGEVRVSAIGNGVTTEFPYGYRFFENADLVVYLVDDNGETVGGVGVAQVLDTDYTVAGANDPAGGSITFVTPPPTDYTVVIINDPPLEQLTDYVNSDAFPAASHEDALDRLMKIAQRTRDLIDRCLKIEDASSDAPPSVSTILSAADTATTKASEASTSATNAATSATLASQWATLTGALVASTDYSSKEWAVGIFTRGLAGGGSAKDWANYTAGPVNVSEYSAKYNADLAASYAASLSSPWSFGGTFDPSGGSFPALDSGSNPVVKGQVFIATADGTVDGVVFSDGDQIVALVDTPSTTIYAANWLRMQGSITRNEIAPVTPPMFRNRCVNGDHQVDQDGKYASRTVAVGSPEFLMDMWEANVTGANVTGERIAGTLGTYKYRFTGAAGNTAIYYYKYIEGRDVAHLASKDIVLSVNLANSLLTTVQLVAYYCDVQDDFNAVTQIATTNITVDSTETRYEWTFNAGANVGKGLQILLAVYNQVSGTWDIGDLQVEEGTVATPFERRPYEVELAMCQRYYEVTDRNAESQGLVYIHEYTNAAHAVPFVWHFKVPKWKNPLFGTFGSFLISNMSSSTPVAAGLSKTGIPLYWTSTGAVTCYAYNNAQSGFIADARP